MLATSSRTHSYTYATLFTVVLVCASVHLADILSGLMGGARSQDLLFITAIVAALLAPPASLLVGLYSRKLIQVQEQLKRLALTDPLTDLLNRRAFSDAFNSEKADFERTGQPLSLALIDIDQMTQINRRHGDLAGDDVLKAVADVMRRGIEPERHTVARWNGQQFAVLMKNTRRRSAIRVAARLRQAIETLCVVHADRPVYLTASVGLIECEKSETLENAISRASRCLSEAKSRGRNKVVAFPAPVNDDDAPHLGDIARTA